MTKRISAVIAAVLATSILIVSVPERAHAEQYGLEYKGWGPRGGLSTGPDQIFVGAHFDLGEFAAGWHFIPSADIGFGDHQTLISLNPDVTYHFPVRDVGALYVGGLFALEWWHFNDVPRYVDDTETDLGLHLLGGLILDQAPVLFELSIGLVDAPDAKLAVGYTFAR